MSRFSRAGLFRFVVLGLFSSLSIAVLALTTTQEKAKPVDPAAYEEMMAAQVLDVGDLGAFFEEERELFILIVPPDPGFILEQPSGPILPFPWKTFPANFVANLVPEYENSVPVYSVVIMEDPLSRETVFATLAGKRLFSLPPTTGYDPFAFVKALFPALYSGQYSAERVDYLKRLYDPSRVRIIAKLIPSEYVEPYLYVAARLAKTDAVSSPRNGLLRSPESASNIVLEAMVKTTNGLRISIGYPDAFTNRLDVFTSSDLMGGVWGIAVRELSTAGTNEITWVAPYSDWPLRFLCAANADVDTDGDGYPDMREVMVYQTNPNDSTSRPVRVSGVVSYTGPETGSVQVLLVTAEESWALGKSVVLPGPGAYTNDEVGNFQNYWVKAFRDVNGSFARDAWEPWGLFSTNALYVTGDVSGINITMKDQASLWGTISYAGSATGNIHVLALTASNSWQSPYTQVISWEQGMPEQTGGTTYVSFPLNFSIVGLPASNYWIRAFVDENYDGEYTHLEAAGEYSASAIAVSNRMTGINFTLAQDSDEDGMPDWWELSNGLNPTNADALGDVDADSMNNLYEYLHDLNPASAEDALEDSDGDGYFNVYECAKGSHPRLGSSIPSPDVFVPQNGSIQGAINSITQDYGIVMLSTGVFKGASNRNLNFNGKKLMLTSVAGAMHTTINCENNGRGFLFYSGETRASVLSGVKIRKGISSFGGGIWCENSSPTILDCIVQECSAEIGGGGMSAYSNASPKVDSCVFQANTAGKIGGGIYCMVRGTAEITRCTIQNNSAFNGGGFASCTSAPLVTKTALIGNWTTTTNTMGGGALVARNPSAVFENCLFARNRSQNWGGGLAAYEAHPYLNNCTMYDNRAGCTPNTTVVSVVFYFGPSTNPMYSYSDILHETPGINLAGGGVFSYQNSGITLRNSILWSNASSQAVSFHDSSNMFSYCNIQDLGPMGSNIRTNPSLTFAGYLRPDSPCINAAGTNDAPPVDVHDEIRPHGGGVDMGWDEYVDSDSDQLPDWWELQYFASLTGATAVADSDADGVDNLTEYQIGGDPFAFADTDGDGLSDDYELMLGTNPNDWDTDADDMGDHWEHEYGFNPVVSNSASANADGDDWTDQQEADQGTHPLLEDTDEDGVLDHLDADPLDPENSQEATAANTTLLTMTIGDSSGSHSERYRMRIGPYDLYMSHVNASDYMFSKTVRVPLGKMYPQSYIESLPDDDDDGDYDAEVSGSGIYVLDTAGVLGGHHEDSGFNSGYQFFSVYVLSDSETQLVEPDRKNAYTEEPINVINGNVTMGATDMALPGPFFPLVFGRHYNSRSLETGNLGPCWSHSYEWRLEDRPSDQYMGMLGHWKVLTGGEGSRYWFMVQSNNVFVPPPGEGVVLEAMPEGFQARYDGGVFQRFNTNGQLTSLADAFGNELSIARTNPALPSAITSVFDGNGQYLAFEHASGRLARVRTPSTNLWISFSYNASGELERVERMLDGASTESLYAYDTKCHSLTQYVNALGHDFNYAYSYTTNTAGGWTSWGIHMVLRSNEYLHAVDYTNAGPHCSRVDYVRGSQTQAFVYAIDPVAHLITSIAGPGGTGVLTRYVYDGALNPVEESRHDYARGEYIRMQRSYDARHRVTAYSAAYGTNPPAKGWLYEWDAAYGLPSKVTDPCDATILMSYTNHRMQDVSTVGESGQLHRTSFSYTTNGLLLAVTNAMGHWVRHAYNERGLLSSVIPQQGPIASFVYDELGYLQQATWPGTNGLRTTTFDHDALGQLKSITYPDQLGERFAYDSLGNLTSLVDRAGRSLAFTYAPTRKLQSVTRYWAEASNTPVTVRFDYDNQFNTLKITDPLGRPAETYALDLQDRPVCVTNLEGQAMHITYGLDHFVRTIQRFDGTTVSNAYDTQGNLSRVQYGYNKCATFEYYANGLLKIASNQTPAYKVVITNRYDCENRLQQIDFPLGNTWLAYRYYPGGQRSNLCTKAFTNSYHYDEAERIAVMDTALGAFHSEYNTNNGLLESLAYPNGITGLYQYDDLDRVTRIAWVRSNVVLRSRAYAYNAIGQITNLVKENGAFTSYDYDSLDRLTAETLYTSASSVVKTTRWQYDLAGNRTNMIVNSQTNRYLYEEGNRLSGWNSTVRYGYNAAGQVTNVLRESGKLFALSWSAGGQMEAVYTNGVYEESFLYDAFGRMWYDWRRSGLYSLHDGAQIAAESFLNGVPANSYIWGPGIDNLLASKMYKFPTYHTNYFLKDHLGSVLAIANAAGDIVESYEYDAWGAVSMYNGAGTPITTSQVGNIYLWQGRAYYPRTGLYYFRARWYDPSIGRFISKDPIGLSGGLNLYEFCGSDPINARDPFGLDWLDSTANYFAGAGDVLSFGVTRKIRDAFPDYYMQDYSSGSYKGGEWTGMGYSLALGGGRLAYAGAAKGGSMILLRQGATAANTAKAVRYRNALKTGFNLGMTSKDKMMTMARAWDKYGDYADIIRAAGRTATGAENALFGIPYSWNLLGGYFFGAGMTEAYDKSSDCE